MRNRRISKLIVIILAMLMAIQYVPLNAFAEESEDLVVSHGTEDYLSDYFTALEERNATTVGAMPCLGNARAVVFYVDFPGEDPAWTKTTGELEDWFFSDELKNETGAVYDWDGENLVYGERDSLRSFYYRSSYGKLDITGSVFDFTATKGKNGYSSNEDVLEEAVEYYKDVIAWDEYDANSDGYVDAVYLVMKTGVVNYTSDPAFPRDSYVGAFSKELGNEKICKVCVLGREELTTLCHETCHLMGPPDIYGGTGLCPGGTHSEEIMTNGGLGDLPGIMKFVLGWIDDPVFVSGEGTAAIELASYSRNGQIVVVYPNGERANNHWLIIEYLTPVSNNVRQGIKVWKTEMDIEGFFKSGEDGFSPGFIASPYQYLEALTPSKTLFETGYDYWPYYYGTGESITPYTLPNTDYGVSYRTVQRLNGTDKYIDESGFSGIYVHCSEMDTEAASLLLEINNSDTADSIEASIGYMPDIRFKNTDEGRKLFALVKADKALAIKAEPSIVDQSSGETLPVEYELMEGGREVYFYISDETAENMDGSHGYSFPAEEYLRTEDNRSVWFKNYDDSLPVFAGKSTDDGSVSWTLNMLNGVMEIHCREGADNIIEILNELGGDFYRVEEVDERIVDSIDASLVATTVIIPDSMTAVREGMFQSFTNLQKVYIGAGVREIYPGAFYGGRLESIAVSPDNPYYSSTDGILLNKEQTRIVCYPGGRDYFAVPDGITEIGDYAFYYAFTRPGAVQQRIVVPEGIERIGDYAFYQTAAYEFSLPASVTYLGTNALNTALTLTIEVSPDNEFFTSEGGCLYDKGLKTLIRVPGDYHETLVLPEALESIDDSACELCTYLPKVVFPDDLIEIGNRAFQLCLALTSADLPEHVSVLGDECFMHCTNLVSLQMPASLQTVGRNAFSYCSKLTYVDYGGSAESWDLVGIGTNYDQGNPFEQLDVSYALTRIAGKTATCEEEGILEHWISTVTGKKYRDPFGNEEVTDEELVIPSAHIPGDPVIENVVEPADGRNGSHDKVVYCTRCGRELERTTITDEYAGPAFRSQSLVLSGQIGVNFFMELPEIGGVDYSESYMTFRIGNDPTEYRDDFDPNHMNSAKTRYGFTCYVNSIQMADTITAVFHYGDGKTVSKEFSVSQYIEIFEQNITSFNTKTIALIRSIADFGHYEQIYLAEVNGWTIGENYTEMEMYYTEEYDYSSILSAVNSKAFVKDLGSSDVEKATYRLHLDSETTMDVYLTPRSGTTLTASATFNGKTYRAVQQFDGRYLVRIPNIPAHKLGDMITISGTAGSSFTVQVSALSYTRSVLNNAGSNKAAKDGLSALYAYYAAVLDYRS